MREIQLAKKIQLPEWLIVGIKLFISLWALSEQSLTVLEWGYQVDIPVIKWFFAVLKTIDGWGLETLFMAIGLGAVYYEVQDKEQQKNGWLSALCIFFAISTVFGMSYSQTGTWDYIFHGRLQFGLAVLVTAGYYFAYKNGILFVNYCIKQKKKILRTGCRGKTEKFLFEKHAFFMPFLVILVMGLPWLIILWPGALQADSLAHLWQYYQIIPGNAMSPVAVTWLMGKTMDIGKILFHSDNAGLFLYNGSQFMAQTLIFAYSFCVLKRMRTPVMFRWLTLAFYAIYPIFPAWGYTYVKDTGYYLCTFLFVLVLADTLHNEDRRPVWWQWALLMVGAVGMSLFRNNGLYIAIVTMAAAILIYRKYWKLYLMVIFACLSMTLLIDKVYMPSHNYIEGPVKESLSIPMQMTARYLKEHMEEVTPEEREVLQKMFTTDLEEIAVLYNPEVSDPVKNCFVDYPTEKEMSDYIDVWMQQLTKHPDTYIQAFLNHTYGYFYPEKKNFWDSIAHFRILGRQAWTDDCVSLAFGMEEQTGRNLLEQYTGLVYRMPVVGMLFSAGLHMYVLLGCLVYLLAKQKSKSILVLIPSLCMILCIMSPVNALFRYMLPLIVVLPINLAWCYYSTHKEGQEAEVCS